MASIIHMMGPTCAGKSTLIDTLLALSDTVHPVQIGKLLRKKYGEDYFKGQGAPVHTQAEALQLYYDTINEGIALGKKVILVDGQPRDLGQARQMMMDWPDHRVTYLMVHADHEVREFRARAGRKPGPDLELAIARLTNDYKNCYVVMTELLRSGRQVDVVDTGSNDFDVDTYAKDLLNEHAHFRSASWYAPL